MDIGENTEIYSRFKNENYLFLYDIHIVKWIVDRLCSTPPVQMQNY